MSLHTIGALGKLFFEVVENADMKPDEGLRSVGATWLERVRFAIVPQVMPNFVSYTLLRMEINVRASTIIGAVGGGGIGEAFRMSIGRDHAAKTYAIVILLAGDHYRASTSSRAGCARRLVGRQSFDAGPGSRVMSTMSISCRAQSPATKKYPEVFRQNVVQRWGLMLGLGADGALPGLLLVLLQCRPGHPERQMGPRRDLSCRTGISWRATPRLRFGEDGTITPQWSSRGQYPKDADHRMADCPMPMAA
jgi:hypothetical protein